MRPVDIEGVRVEMPSNNPVVLLRERGTTRVLPIWIGAVEATAIAFAQQGVAPPRPLTHDLLVQVIAALGDALAEVRIVDLREGTFYAVLVMASGIEISCRPSDGIAVALRTGSAVLVADEVLDEAAVEVAQEPDDEVEKFREFLDHVNPEDFGTGAAPAPE